MIWLTKNEKNLETDGRAFVKKINVRERNHERFSDFVKDYTISFQLH